jgi:hypothetical protein
MSKGGLPVGREGHLVLRLAFLQRRIRIGPLSLDRRNLNFRPGPDDLVASRDQAMAAQLRGRREEGVVKPKAREAGEARQERAGALGDGGVDRVDTIREARDDLVEPVALGAGAERLGSR